MFRKTILLAVSVLLAVGLAACGNDSNSTINGPDQPIAQNELKGYDTDRIAMDTVFALELGVGIDSKTADALLKCLPTKTLSSAESILINYSPMPQATGFSVVATWKGNEKTHCEIWEIDLSLEQLALEPLFTMLVVNEENGVISSGFGNEIISISDGMLKYTDGAKIFVHELCMVLGFIFNYACSSNGQSGEFLCTVISIITSTFC